MILLILFYKKEIKIMEIENSKKSMSNDIWLNYFNDILFEKSVITENERNKMKNLINSANVISKNKKPKVNLFQI